MVEKRSTYDRRWTKEEVKEIALQARSQLNLQEKGSIFAKTKKRVFKGTDLALWLNQNASFTKVQNAEDANELGNLMMEDLHFAEIDRNAHSFVNQATYIFTEDNHDHGHVDPEGGSWL